MESESLIFTGLEIQREYLYETGVHIEKNKLGNTWWQKQAHVSYARMCVMDTYEYYGSNVPLFRRNGYRQSGVMIP